MRRHLLTGIVPRLLVPTVAVLGLVAVLLTAFSARTLAARMRESFVTKGEALAASIASAIEASASERAATLQSIVDAHAGVQGVRYVWVEGENRRVLAHTFVPRFPPGLRERTPPAPGPGPLVRDVELQSGPPLAVIDVAAPIGGGALGTVHVGMDRTLIDAAVAHLRHELAMTGALVVLLAVLVGTLSAWWLVVRPLLQLERAVVSQARGGDEARVEVPVHAKGEVGSLARAFAQMVERRRRIEHERTELLRREQRARAEAVRASGAKDLFLATLSHELRTPLASILLQTQLLQRAHPEDARVRHGLQVIDRAARAQASLVSDLLDVSRFASGRLEIEHAPVDFESVVRATADMLRPEAEARSLALLVRVQPLPAPVRGDRVRLQQVVWNLLSNAIKFTPPGGRVEVALGQVEDRAALTVSDTGIGIPAEYLPHLFERFSQQDPSATRAHGGLGLGLAIVRHLVEAHGGTVRAQSPGPGRGAAFRVELPLEAAAGEALPAPRPPGPDLREVPGTRVLVIDDDPDIRTALVAVLSDIGARVLAVGSTREGLRALESFRPQLVLCDLAMPGDDGFAFVRELRRRAAGARIPAAALTALASAEASDRALKAGFQMHLAKPVDAAELVSAVERLAGSRQPPPHASAAAR